MAKTTQQFFEARPASVGLARSFVSTVLAEWNLLDRAEDIRLCVSELATNALVHGTNHGHGFLVRLDADARGVHLEVHDSRRSLPIMRPITSTATSGRGLLLVDALADHWGVRDRTPFGKIVWSSFRTHRAT